MIGETYDLPIFTDGVRSLVVQFREGLTWRYMMANNAWVVIDIGVDLETGEVTQSILDTANESGGRDVMKKLIAALAEEPEEDQDGASERPSDSDGDGKADAGEGKATD